MHEGLVFSTLKIRPAGLAVVSRRAGEHVGHLNCGDRHRPGREHANREQLTLAGARVGGKGQDNLSCAGMTTEGALATIYFLNRILLHQYTLISEITPLLKYFIPSHRFLVMMVLPLVVST